MRIKSLLAATTLILSAAAPPAHAAAPNVGSKIAAASGFPNLGGVLTDIFNHGTSTVIAWATLADSVAGRIDPNSPFQPPYNVYNYNAHMCLSNVIPWLQSAGGGSGAQTPAPTDASGKPVPAEKWDPVTTLVMAQISVSTAQEFVNKLTGNGLPPGVPFNCAAWGRAIIGTPVTIAANVNLDILNLIKGFAQ
jgi:hypothetical protein